MMKKVYIFILLMIALLPLFVFSSSAADKYSSGTYLVSDKKGSVLYSSYENTDKFQTIAPESAYLSVIKVVGKYGYTVYDSVYGWIDLSSGCKYVSKMPYVT